MKHSKEQIGKLNDWLKKDDSQKHKTETYVLDDSKTRIYFKCKTDNKSGGIDWKSKIRKAIKID